MIGEEIELAIKKIVDDKAKYTDWSTREDIKANLQVDLIVLLDEYGYPPVTIDDVYKEVLEQAENFKKYAKENGKFGSEVVKGAEEIYDIAKLLDYVANNLPVSYEKKQKVLEAVTLTERYEVLLALLLKEMEIVAIKNDFQKKVRAKVDKHQKEYLLREQMGVIREELGEDTTGSDADEYLERSA